MTNKLHLILRCRTLSASADGALAIRITREWQRSGSRNRDSGDQCHGNDPATVTEKGIGAATTATRRITQWRSKAADRKGDDQHYPDRNTDALNAKPKQSVPLLVWFLE
jgi:hypothetical protein